MPERGARRLPSSHVRGAQPGSSGTRPSRVARRSGGCVRCNACLRVRACVPSYKDELGAALVNFARVVPDGLLVFFPSYHTLNSAVEHWKQPVIGGARCLGLNSAEAPRGAPGQHHAHTASLLARSRTQAGRACGSA